VITVYVSIGNSDDKLTQAEWANYVQVTRNLLRLRAREIHGEWYSAADSDYQNACFCAVLGDDADTIRKSLAELRAAWRQDSIAWAEAPVTEFI
jgi:hypothetical protein